MSAATTSDRLPWPALAAACGLLALHATLYFGFRLDDAFIVLRYAQNLNLGRGMVFNPGERVEGFTSPAMVVLESLFMRLGVDALMATKLLGLACGMAIVVIASRLTLLIHPSRLAATLAAVLVALQPSLAVDCVNGLETAPFAVCLAAALYHCLVGRSARSSLTAGVFLAFACLLRPEGVLALLLAAVWFSLGPGRGVRLAALLAPVVLVAAPLLAWKAMYYGSLVPNTYLAKVPAHGGGVLLSGFIYTLARSPGLWEPAGVLCLFGLAIRSRPARIMAVFAAVWLAYIVSTGGDWMPVRRFMIPLLPATAAGFAAAFEQALEYGRRRAAPAGTAIVAGAALWLLPMHAEAIVIAMDEVDVTTLRSSLSREQLGDWLGRVAPPAATVAMLDVGAVAYRSGLNVIDTGGLTDPVIARLIHASRGEYTGHLFFPTIDESRPIVREVLARHPEYVVLLMEGDFPKMPLDQLLHTTRYVAAYRQDQAFATSPEFHAAYRFVCVVPESPEHNYNVFVRRDLRGEYPTEIGSDGLTYCRMP